MLFRHLSKIKNKTPSTIKLFINLKPVNTSWGGGNQFVKQLEKYMCSRGHSITYQLESDISSILMIDPRKAPHSQFSLEEIAEFKQSYTHIPCVHRINECDLRKKTNYMDELLKEANQIADYTVFISQWLKDYFVERWFNPSKPNQVILNGADDRIFYPSKKNLYSTARPLRLVTHHWSDNWMKGFKVYQKIDEMISTGELQNFTLTIIGRWPKEIQWSSAQTHSPVVGKKLAALLRQNHAYITGTLWEPCGMHHIEGAQCGLPLIYHEDGGGVVEYGKNYGMGFRNNIKEVLEKARKQYFSLRDKVLDSMPSGIQMCQKYETIFLTLNNDRQLVN